jgi:antirestriction protein ArdC
MTKTVLIAGKFQNGAGLSGYIAEIGSCFLGAMIGIEPAIEEAASYLESWVTVLKEDKRAIFRAASAAQKAADFLLAAAEAGQGQPVAA